MNAMESWFETVSTALLHYVRTPLFVLAAVFAVILALTVAFAVYEIKYDRP